MLERAPDSKDFQDDRGWTALHYALYWKEHKAVVKLLDAGADVQIHTSDPPTSSIYDFATMFAPFELGTLKRKLPYDASYYNPASNLRALIWLEEMIMVNKRKKITRSSCIEESTILGLVERFGLIKEKASQKTIWCHLPANDWRWVEDLCRAETPTSETSASEASTNKASTNKASMSKAHLENIQLMIERVPSIFGSTKKWPPFCDHRFNEYKPDNMVTVCEQDVIRLYNSESPGLHHPRTLDHYYHDNLDSKGLPKLNQSQVISRYLEKYRNQTPSTQTTKVVQFSTNDNDHHIRASAKYFHELWEVVTKYMKRFLGEKRSTQHEEAGQSLTDDNQSSVSSVNPPHGPQDIPQQPNAYEASPRLEKQPSKNTQFEKKGQKFQPKTHLILVVSQLWLPSSD
ncbi:hypothetical protein F4806DRAFT_500537 [Annulohypoxylon nitens]|nr:hypothetical protein F4806DRAFT_500537 [Annulohypoxylon nitens]